MGRGRCDGVLLGRRDDLEHSVVPAGQQAVLYPLGRGRGGQRAGQRRALADGRERRLCPRHAPERLRRQPLRPRPDAWHERRHDRLAERGERPEQCGQQARGGGHLRALPRRADGHRRRPRGLHQRLGRRDACACAGAGHPAGRGDRRLSRWRQRRAHRQRRYVLHRQPRPNRQVGSERHRSSDAAGGWAGLGQPQ